MKLLNHLLYTMQMKFPEASSLGSVAVKSQQCVLNILFQQIPSVVLNLSQLINNHWLKLSKSHFFFCLNGFISIKCMTAQCYQLFLDCRLALQVFEFFTQACFGACICQCPRELICFHHSLYTLYATFSFNKQHNLQLTPLC